MTSATRRLLLAACAGALAASNIRAEEKVRRLAILAVVAPTESKPYLDALYEGLRELGWTEGRNLLIDVRYTNGQPSQVAAATAELLALKPDVFHAALDYVATAAAASANSPPIVFAIGNDPVGMGLVKSLAHPGTRATGFSSQNLELTPKRLSLLKEVMPSMTMLGVLEYSEGQPQAQVSLKQIQETARRLGIRTLYSRVDTVDELESVFGHWTSQGVRGFMIVPNIWFAQGETLRQLSALALKSRSANCNSTTLGADAGLLMSYSTDLIALYRRSAKPVDQILKGANPANIPVEQADVFELVLNQRTARAIGVTFPRALLLRATRVIE